MKIRGTTKLIGLLSSILAFTASSNSAFAGTDWEFKCGLTRKDNKVDLIFIAEAKATSLRQPTKYKLDQTGFAFSDTQIADPANKFYAIFGCAWKPALNITSTKSPPNRPAPQKCFEKARVLCQTNHTYKHSPGGGYFVTFTEALRATYGQQSGAIFEQLKNQCSEKARDTFTGYFEGATVRTVTTDCDNDVIETELGLNDLFGATSNNQSSGQYEYVAVTPFVSDVQSSTEMAPSNQSESSADMNSWWIAQQASSFGSGNPSAEATTSPYYYNYELNS